MTAVRCMHASMQFSDTPEQHRHDAEAIFARASKRGVKWVTGTETGPGAGTLGAILKAACAKYGYRFYTVGKTDNWIAVRNSFISSGFVGHYQELFPGRKHVHPSRGILWVEFVNKSLGKITVGAGHYMTKGRHPGDPFFVDNVRYIDHVNRWAKQHGAGKALVFYGGDQNMVDRTSDTFHGGPLTSLWDELHKYESTGHDTIDVIASYDYDKRVKGLSINALNDKEFPLFSDHFLVEGEFGIATL